MSHCLSEGKGSKIQDLVWNSHVLIPMKERFFIKSMKFYSKT